MLNVIIVSKFLRAPQKLALHEPKVAASAAAVAIAILGLSFGAGFAARGANGAAKSEIAQLRSDLGTQQAALKEARENAQIEINAIAARVGELQAQANRLNALGERLTRSGKLNDGEFDFERTPGMGGNETVSDAPAGDLLKDLNELQAQFDASGRQLSVLESMLYNQQLERQSVPSQRPSNGYITSGFGTRSDPFSGGRAHHLGIDFDANTGDPVRSAAGGVVSYAGVKTGYGNVVEIDHGNGYSTLYGHNSRLLVRVGDLVRSGQEIAKAGSTGRSTGPHVHFEVHQNGRPVNPRPFLDKIGG
ncbi:M23 family metallopeptidase [Arenimonas sp.]|uniref:M23 family metallopeptidase n=1 Tax=Arenimonas sp. TaxID=1872635 RepID=UPI0039E43D00